MNKYLLNNTIQYLLFGVVSKCKSWYFLFVFPRGWIGCQTELYVLIFKTMTLVTSLHVWRGNSLAVVTVYYIDIIKPWEKPGCSALASASLLCTSPSLPYQCTAPTLLPISFWLPVLAGPGSWQSFMFHHFTTGVWLLSHGRSKETIALKTTATLYWEFIMW